MKNSPGFSSFRQLIDTWDEAVENDNKKAKIKSLIDGQGLIMFFKKDGNIFGAPENSRIVFAKMKNPDEDVTPDWENEANFGAFNLMQALQGNSAENIFSAKDMPKIIVINQDEAEKSLMSCPSSPEPTQLDPMHSTKQGIGVIKLKDKKA